MNNENYFKPAKLFKCEKCNLFFFSYSRMKKPTHYKCAGHKTRLATKEEIDKLNQTNKIHLCYNEELTE